jgi:hypothetical protein
LGIGNKVLEIRDWDLRNGTSKKQRGSKFRKNEELDVRNWRLVTKLRVFSAIIVLTFATHILILNSYILILDLCFLILKSHILIHDY